MIIPLTFGITALPYPLIITSAPSNTVLLLIVADLLVLANATLTMFPLVCVPGFVLNGAKSISESTEINSTFVGT